MAERIKMARLYAELTMDGNVLITQNDPEDYANDLHGWCELEISERTIKYLKDGIAKVEKKLAEQVEDDIRRNIDKHLESEYEDRVSGTQDW